MSVDEVNAKTNRPLCFGTWRPSDHPVDSNSPSFADEHRRLVAELNNKLAAAALGGNERARKRHVSRGKAAAPRTGWTACLTRAALSSSCSATLAACTQTNPGGNHRDRWHPTPVIVANDATVKGGT